MYNKISTFPAPIHSINTVHCSQGLLTLYTYLVVILYIINATTQKLSQVTEYLSVKINIQKKYIFII